MKKTALALALISAFLLSGIMGETSAQTYQIGVSPGDNFSYEVGTSGYIPDFPYYSMDKIGTITVSITSVSGPSINFTTDMSYRNGSKTSQEILTNVQTGGPLNMSVPRFFLSANLGVDDSAIPYRDWPKINDTTGTLYSSGESRETNYFRINALDSNATFYSHIDFYYDKKTGVLVKLYCYGENTNGPYSTSYWLKLEKTNLWTMSKSPYPSQPPFYFLGSSLPDNSYLIIVAVVVVAIAGAVLLVYLRKRKH